jgi:uncharacterized protein YkwD
MCEQTPTSARLRSRAAGAATCAALAVIAAGLLTAPASGASAGPGCPNANKPVSQVKISELRKAAFCLINEQRRRHARKPLRISRQLQKGARKHTVAMTSTGCLAHRCPGEPPLRSRIRRTGYLDGARTWRYAENTGCARTADAMIANWMAITFHRVNILRAKFRDVGIAPSHKRVKGRCKPGYGTFTAVFAFRRR